MANSTIKNDILLKKIYPKPSYDDYNSLNYDTEGLWSITLPNEANIISLNIINILQLTDIADIKILDMTAGCGGNTISFCKYFNNVIGIEMNSDRFNILKTNMICYDFNNYTLICGNSLDYIDTSYDVFFIDPPWGGPEYKKKTNIELYLSNIKIYDVIEMIPSNKLIVLKLPFNYNYDILEKYNIVMKIAIKNINIIFLFKNK